MGAEGVAGRNLGYVPEWVASAGTVCSIVASGSPLGPVESQYVIECPSTLSLDLAKVQAAIAVLQTLRSAMDIEIQCASKTLVSA